MSTPIFPQVIYPIGDLPDGMFYAVVDARGFQYLRDLPEVDLDYEALEGPPTLRDEDVQDLVEPPPLPWHRAA